MDANQKVKTQMCLKMSVEQADKVKKKAMEMQMNKTQYILHCIENQPAIPVFTWEDDDLAAITDAAIQISENIRRLTSGITMIGSATAKDIEKLEAQYSELNGLYSELLMKYKKQRENTTKTARRLVREWKKSERNIS